MSSRSSSLRIKVVALLLSLVALWAFAATVTLRDGLNLFGVSTLNSNVGVPMESLLSELQQERRLSLVYLGGRGGVQRAALHAQRTRTDKARADFRELAGASSVSRAADDRLESRLADVFEELDRLDAGRATIDASTVSRSGAVAAYTDVIDSGFRMYGALSTLDDEEIAKEARTLIALSRAREVISQEDAMLAGVLAAGRMDVDEHKDFTKLVGAQRFLYAEVKGELRPEVQERLDDLFISPTYSTFRLLEDRVVARTTHGGPVAIRPAEWDNAVRSVSDALRKLELTAADGTVERAASPAMWVLVRLLLAGGLGLLAVIASIVVSITTARSLVRQLEKLRTAARELANERLPRVVERLQRGEQVDVNVEAPPLSFGVDEIGQVGHAFNDVQATAVRVAVEQAELRQGVRDVFLSLARRSQALVHRQLTLLDTMERRTSEPEELESLFRVDHLATRMRRNAENLIVLSGAVPGRGWRNPIPLVDVVRGAVAEVEEYERVAVAPVGSAALAGRAVGDLIHLLAELIENALSFSPPHTMVHVSGQIVGNGYAVEIEDRGLGMSAEDIDDANERLENPPEFNLSSTARLGLFVVGRLAERHHLKVRLRSSPYGGVTAVVLIPTSLVVHGESPSTAAAIAAGRRDRGVPRERNGQRDRLRDATLHRGLTPVESAPNTDGSEETPPGSRRRHRGDRPRRRDGRGAACHRT